MKYLTTVNGQTFEVDINADGRVTVNGKERIVDFKTITEDLISALIDNASFEALVDEREGSYQVLISGDLYEVEVTDERRQRLNQSSAGFGVAQGELTIKSPMPGLIVDVRVTEGQEVEKGASLCVLESMKMENEIKAPRAGTVSRVHVAKGDSVEQNKPLIVIA
jgi:biotin carboxyl carrier protein